MALPICSKTNRTNPHTYPEECQYNFFRIPAESLVVKRIYSLSAASKRIGGEEYLSSKLLEIIRNKQPILTSLTLIRPASSYYYIPTLYSLAAKVAFYKKKFNIDIDLIPLENIRSTLLSLNQSVEKGWRGLIFYREESYRVTPALFFKNEPGKNNLLFVMDCRSYLEGEINDLFTQMGPPDGWEPLFSIGSRLADRIFDRLEAFTLLKYALLTTKGWEGDQLASLLVHKKRDIYRPSNYSFRPFYIPRQWAVASQAQLPMESNNRLDPLTILNPDSCETVEDWEARHQYSAYIKVVMSDLEEENYSEHEFENKDLNLFLLFKMKKWAAPYFTCVGR
jgi:hypothetical protein